MLTLFLGGLFILILINVPIGIALIATGVIMMLSMGNLSPQVLAQGVYRGIDSFALLAIPFFIWAGEFMNVGGISRRIVAFSDAVLGHIRGGIGYVAVMTSMIFSGVSGSGVADTSAVGSIVLPVMKKKNYDVAKSTALICSAGCTGPIIPPSIPMILYGVYANVSVTKLFMGGLIPGVLIGVALMVVWYFHSKKMNYPSRERTSLKEMLKKTWEALLALLLPVIIMGCIVTGVATPTESAVIAVVYAIVVSIFVYKELKLSDIPKVLLNGAITSAGILFVVGGAVAVSYPIAIARIPELLTNALLAATDNVYVLLVLVNVLLLVIGCVLDTAAAILLLTPILLPVMARFNIDPVYLGLVLVVNLAIGQITPPVGTIMYVGCNLSKVTIGQFTKAAWPFIAVMFAILILITYVPDLIMFVPNLLK